jgi:integrase
MARDLLSDARIRTAKSHETPYKLHDGAGLYLHVQPNGSKYWRLKFRYQGKEKVFAVGVYPDVGLAAARTAALEARGLIREGKDPVAERKRLRESSSETFQAISEEWVDSRKNNWSPTYKESVETALAANLYPHIGSLPIRSISVTVLRDALLIMEKREILAALRKVRMWAEQVFRYAIATGRADNNPAQLLQRTFKTHKPKNFSAITTEKEFGELLRKLSAYDGEVMTKLALLLMAHLVPRTKELRLAKWPEFDFEKRTWTIPAEKMKMRKEHVIPLSRQAIAILEELRGSSGRSEFVLPNANNSRKPISENTMIYALYRLGYHGRATVHGFRSSFSTLCNKRGYDPDWIERQLAHSDTNKVRAAYHREQYIEERRGMLQDWSDFIDRLIEHEHAPTSDMKVNIASLPLRRIE